MLLSELFATEVRTTTGESLGRVRDVRLVQDGPLDGYTAKLRVDTLVVAPSGRGLRLGYHHGGLRSPWLIRTAVRLLNRRVHTIDWSSVHHHDTDSRLIVVDFDGLV